MSNGPKIGIVLSGTAPALTLMSGVMLAFDECNVEFEVISTTGVGGLIGMLYLAPKGKTRKDALSDLPNLFVSDWLYPFVPINFKVFHKNSPLAAQFYELRKNLKLFDVAPDDPAEGKRFLNDWLQLWATILTPPSYQSARSGLMSHVPLVDDLVDFNTLNSTPSTRFYLNAFSLSTRRLRLLDNFDKKDLNVDNYNGAQSMYMLFPPVQTADDLLVTGATKDPTGLQAIWLQERDKLDAVLALAPEPECFWRAPTNAYDAFQLMLMNPIVHLQRLMFTLYARTDVLINPPKNGSPPPPPPPPGLKLPRLYAIKTPIPEADRPKIFNWTHKNAVALQKIGHDAALPIAKRLGGLHSTEELQERLADFRFNTAFNSEPRATQILDGIFWPAFHRFGDFINGIQGPRDDSSGGPDGGGPGQTNQRGAGNPPTGSDRR